jgi:hypothetical protein
MSLEVCRTRLVERELDGRCERAVVQRRYFVRHHLQQKELTQIKTENFLNYFFK